MAIDTEIKKIQTNEYMKKFQTQTTWLLQASIYIQTIFALYRFKYLSHSSI